MNRQVYRDFYGALSVALSLSGFALSTFLPVQAAFWSKNRSPQPLPVIQTPVSPANQPPASAEPAETPITVDINSKTLAYNQDKAVYVATGLVHVVISEQNSELFADQITYDQAHEVLIAEGHVKIIRDGQVTEGRFARVDLTRQSALINEVRTRVDTVRVKAQTALVDGDYVELRDGKVLLDRAGVLENLRRSRIQSAANTFVSGMNTAINSSVGIRSGYQPFLLNSKSAVDFVEADSKRGRVVSSAVDDVDSPFNQFYEAHGLSLDLSEVEPDKPSLFKTRMKEIEVTEYPDQYQKVKLHWPKTKFTRGPLNGATLFTIPSLDFGQDKMSNRFDYLGPELGFNPDLGGFYAGPGLDFKLGPGMAKISPIASFGKGVDRDSDGSFSSDNGSLGVGGLFNYQDNWNRVFFGRVSQNNYNVFTAQHQFFRWNPNPFLAHGITRALVTGNQSYNGNLLSGIERPAYSAQLTDQRVLWRNQHTMLQSYSSLGAYRDEFNPTNRSTFFVNRTSAEPETAGRLLLQAQVNNTEPLATLGEYFELGYQGQISGSAYSTGDFYGIVRGGPTVNFRYKDRFLSQVFYALGTTVGDTPFVFDSFFLGNQAVSVNNALRINPFITIGNRSDFNLSKDNARGDLVVGNVFYLSAGPRDVKFTLGFDLIRLTTYFGLNFYPSTGTSELGFDKLKVFQAPASVGFRP